MVEKGYRPFVNCLSVRARSTNSHSSNDQPVTNPIRAPHMVLIAGSQVGSDR